MSDVSSLTGDAAVESEPEPASGQAAWRSPDWRRKLQLGLAAIWLLDGVLQLQPFMFTAGSKGFSGMLAGTASGNPSLVAQSISWNASLVDHHAVVANAIFAAVQILLGLGIAWRPAVRPTLAASVLWSLGVWWFGEGLGGVLRGNATPIGGGPGAVLFYALLAVLLWPSDPAGVPAPFAAAGAIGPRAARAVWALLWASLAFLALLGSGRSPQGVHDLINTLDSGQPGWLAAIDAHAESLVAGQGLTVAGVFAVICFLIAVGVFLPQRAARASVAVAVLVSAVVWVVGQNFGGILPGGATDPNSGPVLILLALAYWPRRPGLVEASSGSARVDTLTGKVA
jgi:hypothetical protein